RLRVGTQRPAHRLPLARQALIVYAGASAGDVIGVEAGQRADHGRGRAGVADPHVARQRDVEPRSDLPAHELTPDLDGLACLLDRHRRTNRDVAGPMPDLYRSEVRLGSDVRCEDDVT